MLGQSELTRLAVTGFKQHTDVLGDPMHISSGVVKRMQKVIMGDKKLTVPQPKKKKKGRARETVKQKERRLAREAASEEKRSEVKSFVKQHIKIEARWYASQERRDASDALHSNLPKGWVKHSVSPWDGLSNANAHGFLELAECWGAYVFQEILPQENEAEHTLLLEFFTIIQKVHRRHFATFDRNLRDEVSLCVVLCCVLHCVVLVLCCVCVCVCVCVVSVCCVVVCCVADSLC
jgi:hypothetical protein